MTPHESSNIPTGQSVNEPVLLATSKRSTQMTITGSMDPQEESIYLKVKITDKDGMPQNLFMPEARGLGFLHLSTCLCLMLLPSLQLSRQICSSWSTLGEGDTYSSGKEFGTSNDISLPCGLV